MKYGILLLILSVFLVSCNGNVVKIKLVNETSVQEDIFVYYNINGQRNVDTLQFNSNGFLLLELDETKMNNFGIFYKYTRILPQFELGDVMTITLTEAENEMFNAHFDGDKFDLNQYKFEREQVLNLRLSGKLYKDEFKGLLFKEITPKVDSMQHAWKRMLKEANIRDKSFVNNEKIFLDYYFRYLKSSWMWYAKKFCNTLAWEDQAFTDFISSIKENESLENASYYYRLLDQKVKFFLEQEKFKGFHSDSACIVEMNIIKNQIESQAIRDRMLTESVGLYISFSADNQLENSYALYKALCTNENLKKRIEKVYENSTKLVAGFKAPNFQMFDKDGNEYSLDDFKGKYLYIDVWATWCGPCKQELPILEEIYNELKEQADIEIISVSVDKNVSAWEKMIDEHNYGWSQYIVKGEFNSELATKYNIRGIPHFILIDREGNLVDAKAKRPSNKKLLIQLKSLLEM